MENMNTDVTAQRVKVRKAQWQWQLSCITEGQKEIPRHPNENLVTFITHANYIEDITWP